MKVLIITTALVAALIFNTVNAGSETIKCDTGFFSSKTFIIKEDDIVTTDLGYTFEFLGETYDAMEFTQETHLLSVGRTSLDTHSNYRRNGSLEFEMVYPHSSFNWKKGDLRYSLWDSSKGWAIQIKEKDWSSSEGDHWDEVLEKTYCK